MNATHETDTPSGLTLNGQSLRERLAVLADSIARTEEDVANTLDRLAAVRPRDADRLRARAAFARLFAASERERASDYGLPTADPSGKVTPPDRDL